MSAELVQYAKYVSHMQQCALHTDPKNLDIIHATLGLSGEVGEFVEHVKKKLAYDKPYDPAKIRGELGDIFHYYQAILNMFGFDLGDVIQSNIDKLAKRYPNGFDADMAKSHKDG